MGYLPKRIKRARHRSAMWAIAMAGLRGATFKRYIGANTWRVWYQGKSRNHASLVCLSKGKAARAALQAFDTGDWS